MGVFKEEAHAFEQVAERQKQIFDDACDYGYPYNTGEKNPLVESLIQSVKHFQELDKLFPDEKPFIRRRETWTGGVTVVIRIAWEIDGGMECGSEYTITFCSLKHFQKKPYFFHPGCDAYISVDSIRYKEPK
jgi:hypothetical protein